MFERLEARTATEVTKNANAHYALGQIAEEQVRWADAARHYARAADLARSFANLLKAREFTWRAGDYPSALALGSALIDTAQAEFGDDTTQHATALNEHALSLEATGRFDEAEPLYRQAIKIGAKTLAEDHPAYAIDLNNLAELLNNLAGHRDRCWAPAYATWLNNLATGRFDEAEPHFRQAIEIGAKTLGEDHPAYATRLNNLALLLQATGRFDGAEPLYRQAIEVLEVALGPDHPSTVTVRENLEIFLRQKGGAGGSN